MVVEEEKRGYAESLIVFIGCLLKRLQIVLSASDHYSKF